MNTEDIRIMREIYLDMQKQAKQGNQRNVDVQEFVVLLNALLNVIDRLDGEVQRMPAKIVKDIADALSGTAEP